MVKNIYYSADIDRSDYSDERTYYHEAWGQRELMHLGAYWDPGMEFGKNFDRLDQLTKEQWERLLGEYTKDAIKTKLDAMENKPNLKKNYLAVYNTLNNWLSMERQRNPNFGKLPLTPEQELEILKKERGYHVD